tara:strand:- start:683 stop:1945 length:1263 start_codon:yes stop_codon:yes gene_type:complete
MDLNTLTLSSSSTVNWHLIPGGISAPNGFKACGIKANLKPSSKLDLALLLAPENSICAGTFTKSLFRASCIDLCTERLRLSNGEIRAVIINSGQANACTGKWGLEDSLKITKEVASQLSLNSENVLICSTGLIGERIPLKNILAGIHNLSEEISPEGGLNAARAIMTTDLVEKQISLEANLGGRRVRIGGMAKGSGMIHPNMATMLGFITCDARVSYEIWKTVIQQIVDSSFNAISVDGDTSTNDAVLAFSSGSELDEQYFDELINGLLIVCQYLAKAIARDGEGANCLIEVKVTGAKNDVDARLIARSVCSSSLVKTAIHGKDPNWGRIAAACGRSGVHFNVNEFSLAIGPFQLISKGELVSFERIDLISYMEQRMNGDYFVDDIIDINISVGEKSGQATAWGCDLSEDYIRINADYTT